MRAIVLRSLLGIRVLHDCSSRPLRTRCLLSTPLWTLSRSRPSLSWTLAQAFLTSYAGGRAHSLFPSILAFNQSTLDAYTTFPPNVHSPMYALSTQCHRNLLVSPILPFVTLGIQYSILGMVMGILSMVVCRVMDWTWGIHARVEHSSSELHPPWSFTASDSGSWGRYGLATPTPPTPP